MRVEKSPEPKVLEVGSFLGQNAILALHDVEASPHCGESRWKARGSCALPPYGLATPHLNSKHGYQNKSKQRYSLKRMWH